MTLQADQIRSARQHSATPGSAHDKLVRSLRVALPMLAGALVAVMVLAPLTPRGEISFLLDRNKVAVVEDRFRTAGAMYRGADDKGRNFSVTAGSAVQHSVLVPVVQMKDLVARILLADGPAVLTAGNGDYDMSKQTIAVQGPVNVETSDGYRMTASNVGLAIGPQTLVSHGPVEGRVPTGTFSADHIEADLRSRTVSLVGHAKLRMVPSHGARAAPH